MLRAEIQILTALVSQPGSGYGYSQVGSATIARGALGGGCRAPPSVRGLASDYQPTQDHRLIYVIRNFNDSNSTNTNPYNWITKLLKFAVLAEEPRALPTAP